MASFLDLKRENRIKENHIAENEIYIIDEINNIVTSVVALIEYDVFFEGKIVKFGGIAGVSTLPEYRDRGSIKEIMQFIKN